MPPKKGNGKSFTPRALSAADLQRADLMLKNAPRTTDKKLHEIDLLERFLEVNPSIRAKPLGEVLLLFAAQWQVDNFAGTTASVMCSNLRTVVRDVNDLDAARQEVESGRFKAAVSKNVTEIRRRPRVISELPYPGVAEADPRIADPSEEGQRESDRMAFWALMCVTGNRPADVMKAKVMEVSGDAIKVQWGTRKGGRPPVAIRYMYEWGGEAPKRWVMRRWRTLAAIPWCHGISRNIASCIPKWLARWGHPLLDPTGPREKLSTKLRGDVLRSECEESAFELIMDHSMKTSLTSYSNAITEREAEAHAKADHAKRGQIGKEKARTGKAQRGPKR